MLVISILKLLVRLLPELYSTRSNYSVQLLIIRMITKSNDSAAGVRFVFHKYDYIPNQGDTKSYYQLIIKNDNFRRRKNSQVMKEGGNLN